MSYFSRVVLIISAPLAIAALLACVSPAGAKLAANGKSLNKITANGVAQTGVAASARITTSSPLADLNGVAVEAVIVPDAATR